MIPNNAFTIVPAIGTFLYMQDELYPPLMQTVMGGAALNDASNGRLYQPWTVMYDGTNILVNPSTEPVVFTLAVSGVTAISLAFDSNMAMVLAWMTTSGAVLYYYDATTTKYVTREFTGVTSCRVCVDCPLDFYTGMSDVIFGYTTGTNICYRQQRDKYNTEYIIAPSTRSLMRMGPTSKNRLQFETI